ncbi:pyridoxal-phosphate dependent enzyme [Amycolatopsis minnesotensis]|uniref:Cysteine synthase family protein n=1 Tax=Amycolatopsis minnesotensis TaxID=337894 RepID=A0ABP5CXA3_9PSEU
MYEHIADALTLPALINYRENRYVLRFESMKVASALAAVEELLSTGTVDAGTTLVDSSSGIYAYALALACHKHNLNCHIVGSTTIDATLKAQLRILGATLEQVKPSASMKLDQSLRVARIQEYLAEHPTAHWMRQYHDRVHYLGYQSIARTIAGEISASRVNLIGGVGSGASTGGLAEVLRKEVDLVRVTGIQPFGSISFGSEAVSDPSILIAGIGSAIPFGNISYEAFDRIDWVSFDCARSGAIRLLEDTGIFAGLSTGAGYAVAHDVGLHEPDVPLVLVAADTGHRYLDAVYAPGLPAPLPLESLRPNQIAEFTDLALPWSTMDWKRRPFTPAAPGAPAAPGDEVTA